MKRIVQYIALSSSLLSLSAAHAASQGEDSEGIQHRKAAQVEFRKQAAALVSQMTLKEKINLYRMDSAPVERLEIGPHHWWNEALHGVARNGLSTQFPQSISMASTWDPKLIQEMGHAIGQEARARHHENPGRNGIYQGLTIWSPTINLARDPRWGRNEETYGEDPLLTSEMAVAFVKGLQGNHPKYLQTVATVKHFIANNTEYNRYSAKPEISDRDLREHYMPAYRAAVEEADVQSIMSAYNAIKGVPCSASKWLLTDVLRGEWGFSGTVVTDASVPTRMLEDHQYTSNKKETLAALLTAGVDVACALRMNFSVSDVEKAVAEGLMSATALDGAIIQNLTTRMQLGQMVDDADNPYRSIPISVIGSEKHLGIAREIAQKGAVLLRNEPVGDTPLLPLQSGTIKHIIVAGPHANSAFLGHYSGTPSHRAVTPLEGLRAGSKDMTVVMHQFAGDEPQTIPASVLRPPLGENAQNGLKGEYFKGNELAGEPAATRIDRNIDFTWKKPIENVDPLIPGKKFSVRWSGRLVPEISGDYRLAIKEEGHMRVWLDGKQVIDTWNAETALNQDRSDVLPLEAGKSYELKVEYFTPGRYKSEAYLGWTLPRDYDADFFKPGFSEDSESTLVVYVGGFDPAMSGEWTDKNDLSLPKDQRKDLERWIKRYKNVAVVLTGGTIITESWLFEHVPAVMHTWYAGQLGGHALADLITGKVSPSGRLPLIWYVSDQDIPDLDDYAIHTGRTYMYNKQPVQFPFGHGLSYTTFEYGVPRLSNVEIGPADTLVVEVPVRNAGKIAGEEVVQIYVRDLESTVYQPEKKLVAFGRTLVKPGEEVVLQLKIPASRLSYWDVDNQCFTVEAGEFELQIGASSQDIRQTVKFALKK